MKFKFFEELVKAQMEAGISMESVMGRQFTGMSVKERTHK